MELLTPEQIDSIYDATDALFLHRNTVIVPLDAKGDGLEMVMPDGRVLIRGPTESKFDGWREGLQDRIEALDLSRALSMQ